MIPGDLCPAFMHDLGLARPRNRAAKVSGPQWVLGADMPRSLDRSRPRERHIRMTGSQWSLVPTFPGRWRHGRNSHIAARWALNPGLCLSQDGLFHWYNRHLGSLEVVVEQAKSLRSRPSGRNRNSDGLREGRGRRKEAARKPRRPGDVWVALKGRGVSGRSARSPAWTAPPDEIGPRRLPVRTPVAPAPRPGESGCLGQSDRHREIFDDRPLTWLMSSVHDSNNLCGLAVELRLLTIG